LNRQEKKRGSLPSNWNLSISDDRMERVETLASPGCKKEGEKREKKRGGKERDVPKGRSLILREETK